MRTQAGGLAGAATQMRCEKQQRMILQIAPYPAQVGSDVNSERA
jgi:hypothetical protein